ncbi:hypothetical protein T484DRAFT_1940218 [Baffinella frigidus]|nr:hypothetical protein T484DRAFT_1940218 [Cryptophyta sp. CCMP2293]
MRESERECVRERERLSMRQRERERLSMIEGERECVCVCARCDRKPRGQGATTSRQ